MSEEETNDSQASHQDGIDDINSVYNPTQVIRMVQFSYHKLRERQYMKSLAQLFIFSK